ncbi:MAG: hypothetical protein R3F65_12255 [bacterium]
MRPRHLLLLAALVCGSTLAAPRAAPAAYTLFESDPVRPAALSPNGDWLAVTNSPAGTLELMRVAGRRLIPVGSVPVGVEPVAVAWRDDRELWVVNHLSDSVSVVQIDGPIVGILRVLGAIFGLPDEAPGRVVRTLHVGDEPRDIVFAGDRAFVTTAHRGQNRPGDPQLTTPGVGRADVWVFDPDVTGSAAGGSADAIVTLFTDTPRALATSPDGRTVYAAGFRTGNRTTVIAQEAISPSERLPPLVDGFGLPQLPTSMIVQHDGESWRDPEGRVWDHMVRFDLPDLDVFALDATEPVPSVRRSWAGVGTVLFGMAVDPRSGDVFVANTEANNLTRFEGDGAGHGTVRGELHRAQISILGAAPTPTVRHLNKHIDYDACCEALPNPTNAASLATPMTPAVSRDGRTLYVPGYGSAAIGVYDIAQLRDDSFVPAAASQIAVSGGGPASLVLGAGDIAYVPTRFDNAVAIVDLRARREVGKVWLDNPEPPAIRAGRRLLYDARNTSGNGEASCASCHVFGDVDHLAWDLGDPNGMKVVNPNPILPLPFPPPFPFTFDFQALKGPLATQSLRGMANHGPMHWRGDRTGAGAAPSAQPDSGAFDERAAFAEFAGAFTALVGRDVTITEEEMAAFTDFVLALTYPPNPIRQLDNQDRPLEARGRAMYFGPITDTGSNCQGCHTLDPAGNAEFGVEKPGFFGTDGHTAFDGLPQTFKVPHLRNLYQKIGMFGLPPLPSLLPFQPDHGMHLGAQVRGFGMSHDGAVDTIYRFLSARQFAPRPPMTLGPADPGNPGLAIGPDGFLDRKALEAFILAYPSNLAPIVGQQVTVAAHNRADATARFALLKARAEAGECDLVGHARPGARMRGGLYLGADTFRLDGGALIGVDEALAAEPVTFTCVPPGEGARYAFERL